MARNEIKFYGSFDGSKIEEQTKRLNKTIEQSFGNQGIEIFSEENQNFLKREAGNGIRAVKDEIKRLVEETKRFDDELKRSESGSARHNELTNNRLKLTEKLVQRQKELNSLQRSQSRLEGNVIDLPQARQRGQRPGFMSRAGGVLKGGLGRVAGSLPGAAGGIAAGGIGAMAGIGTLGVVLGGITAAATAAAIAIQRMAVASEVYSQQIPTFLKLSAMGQQRVGGIARTTAEQMGFSAQETFGLQEQLTRALGATTQRGSEARIANVLTAARQLAVDPSQIANMGNQLRAAGGTQAASKQLAQILDKAVTKGMDASQASHFLEASTSLLTQLNETGIMSTDRMLTAMADLALDAGISAEQSARILGSMSAAIKGSSGEANAFFQMAAARGGMGGSVIEAQEAVRQGLTGLNLDEVTRGMSPEMAGRTRSTFQNLSGTGGESGDYTRSFAKGILEQLNSIAPDTGTNEALMRRFQVVANLFGKQGAGEGARVLSVLTKLQEESVTVEDQQKLIDSLEKDPEKEWRSAVKNSLNDIALNTASLKARQTFVQTDLGEQIQPVFNKLTELLTKLDEKLLGMVQGAKELKAPSFSFDEIVGFIKEQFMELPEKLSMVWDYLVDGLKSTAQGFLDRFQSVFDIFSSSDYKNNPNKSWMSRIWDKTVGGEGLVKQDDRVASQNPIFQKGSRVFAERTGQTLDKSAASEFQQLLGQYIKRDAPGIEAALKEFNKAQPGEDITLKALIPIFQGILKNTSKMANGKKRVELQGNKRESTAP
jgi:hypothetical protein